MKRTSTHASRNAGSALVSVMVPLLGVLVLGYAFFRSTLSQQQNANENNRNVVMSRHAPLSSTRPIDPFPVRS